MSKEDANPPVIFPLWVPCPGCEGYFCTVCDGCTSWACNCPSIEEMDFDPYTSGGTPNAPAAPRS